MASQINAAKGKSEKQVWLSNGEVSTVDQEHAIRHLRENLMRSHQNPKMKCVYLIDREYEDMPLMKDILHELEDEEVLRLSDAEFGHIMETFNLSETESATFDDKGKFCREPNSFPKE